MTSLWILLLAAGVAGVATITLLPQLTSIPRERWSVAALRPVFLQAVGSALSVGLLGIALHAPPEWVLGMALAGGSLVIGRIAMRYTPIRAVKRLTAALNDDARRPAAMAAIGPALDRARPTNGDAAAMSSWAQAALIGAAYLIDADEPQAARAILQRLRGLTFKGPSQSNHALLWAHVELFALDMVAARSALASVQKPIPMALLAAHCDALEALALACDGDDVRALARVGAWKYAEDWYAKLRLTTRLVAHASRGDDDIRAILEADLARRFGDRALTAAKKLVDR